MYRVCLAIVFLTISGAMAHAQASCDDDQASMNACASDALKAADAKLNASYKEIVKRLADDHDARNLLKESQRAWIAFRDAECAFQASGVDGGSVYPMIYAGCLESLTEVRAADFEVLLNCEEGDMSCPVPAQ